MNYQEFIHSKSQLRGYFGFQARFFPERAKDFQCHLIEWAVRRGRAAIFADCGLGKTLMQLAWAENVVQHTNRPVLVLTPLAVGRQTAKEAAKFGMGCTITTKTVPGINIANYERLHHFDPADFAGVVLDESSILKSFDGARRAQITEFMRTLPCRLLCTATAAPNDYTELGTSSEALGELGHLDMLNRFFKNDQNTIKPMRKHIRGVNFQNPPPMNEKWRFKGHAEKPWLRWVCTWARAGRKPSDFGPFDDREFVLPALNEVEHKVRASVLRDGCLFETAAISLAEQREERRRTIRDRVNRVAELVEPHSSSLIWCHLNQEGDELEKAVTSAVQVSGKDSEEAKEEKFDGFINGSIKRLITKTKIGAWGMNFQHCNHVATFPDHSYESYYQGVRRCWRFGQNKPVTVDIVTTDGEVAVLENQRRKSAAADKMFADLVAHMHQELSITARPIAQLQERIPEWLF